MSTEDGPGLRTTVFFKGCPLACTWCHNPESISAKSHVEWLGVRCIGCRICEGVCPQRGIHLDETGVHTSETCEACGACTAACPTQALEMKGKDYTVDALFDTLMKDRSYWGDNGGVTLSGGEVTLQWKEALALLKKLKDAGVHTAVDTCGLAQWSVFDALIPVTDLFLYDLKLFEDESHKRFTGQSNKLILENFERLCSTSKSGRPAVWVRTPIIPGATDSDDNIRGIASIVRDRVEKWELCAFNNLCRDKYTRLGKEWEFRNAGLMNKSRMQALAALAVASGSPVAVWSGATAQE